jgi:hypothetical protein
MRPSTLSLPAAFANKLSSAAFTAATATAATAAATALPPSRCAPPPRFALPPPPLTLLPPQHRRQAAANIALSRCRHRLAHR